MKKKNVNLTCKFFALMILAINFMLSTVSVCRAVEKKKFEDDLSFVAIVKNEGPYIKEWIEFHKLVGVTKFYIYDNESTDNLKEILKDYIKDGTVVYKYFPGRGQQVPAYVDAITNYKYKTKYMGFIDLDEFVIPVEKQNLVEVIDEILEKNSKAAGVAINWLTYGSSNRVLEKNGLVIENYKQRAPINFFLNGFVKTICDPRRVSEHHLHYVKYKDGFYSVDENGKKVLGAWNSNISCSKLRVNHYFSKSFEEFIKKRERLFADHKNNAKREISAFVMRDNNEVYDNIVQKYIPKLQCVLDIKINVSTNKSALTISTFRDLVNKRNFNELKKVLPSYIYDYCMTNWPEVASAFRIKTEVLTLPIIRTMINKGQCFELKNLVSPKTYNFLMGYKTDILNTL